MAKCPFKNSMGCCVPPGESSGPSCSFSGNDWKRLCAVYPLHAAKSQGKQMSWQEIDSVSTQRAMMQEMEKRGARPSRSSGKKGGCFIATAACESSEAPEVATLRLFRDHILLRRKIGRWFVDTYYCWSPEVAHRIRKRPATCRIVRALLVRPLARVVRLFLGDE